MASLTHPRQVPLWHGALWIRQGASTVLHSPVGWTTSLALWFAFILICSLFPMLGPVFFSLSLPALFAGMMAGCAAVEQGRSLRIPHLLSGFKSSSRRLFQLGMVNIAGETLLTLVLVLWGGQKMIDLQNLSLDGSGNLEQLREALFSLTPLFITLVLLQLALLMMGWFAPALLRFTAMSTLEALTLSTQGCLLNLPAFLLFTLIMGSLLAIATFLSFALPWISGLIGFFIVALIIASVYASYRDVFHETPLPPITP